MKKLLVMLIVCIDLFAHPVNYTIDLVVSYDEKAKEAKIICQSNSKNKCGLFNVNLLDKDDKSIADVKFPFLKEFVLIKTQTKPEKMDFYLRKVPEHKYTKIF
jgi:hypothetical protein